MPEKIKNNFSDSSSLNQSARKVLTNVYKHSGINHPGVDMRAYRAKYRKHWDILDTLEREGYLRRDSNVPDRYYVSLVGISQVSARQARIYLSRFEKIFVELKKHYIQDSRAPIKITDLAVNTGMTLEEVRDSLSYMVEASIWSGHNITTEHISEAWIRPSETVVSLKYKKFRDLINERIRWVEEAKKRQLMGAPIFSNIGKQEKSASSNRNEKAWHSYLKPGFKNLMREINLSIEKELYSLAAMGLRAIIDIACNDKVTDKGTFKEKLAALEQEHYIIPTQKETLLNALELGHAAVHRGYIPTRNQVESLVDIVEHLLKQLYVHHIESQKLKESVPPRKTRKSVKNL